ncbi:MAG: hypothetical protein DDT29_02035 [Dehalococcoidia bacterium]|nr:hypothetical protein [Bacillota bacterium]
MRCKKPPMLSVMSLTILEARRNGAVMASLTPATIPRMLATISVNRCFAPSQSPCTKPKAAVTAPEKVSRTVAHRLVKKVLTVPQFRISRKTPAASKATAATTRPIGAVIAKNTTFATTRTVFSIAKALFNAIIIVFSFAKATLAAATPAAILAIEPNKTPSTTSTGPMAATSSATVMITVFVVPSSPENPSTILATTPTKTFSVGANISPTCCARTVSRTVSCFHAKPASFIPSVCSLNAISVAPAVFCISFSFVS